MKKMLLFLLLMQGIYISIQAQTRYGTDAGTLGTSYSYFGYYAGNAATTASAYNAFFGAFSGRSTTHGDGNTAAGIHALYYNAGGDSNTGVGAQALLSNTSGIRNIAIGKYALYNNTTGGNNTANGYSALYFNTGGHENTATGYLALQANTTGNRNVALGPHQFPPDIPGGALQNNTTGSDNTATGGLVSNTTGVGNSSFGLSSLATHVGSYNCAIGSLALAVFMPGNSPTCTNSYNGGLGGMTGTYLTDANCPNYNNTTSLGSAAKATASNQVRIGNSDVTSIGGQVAWTTLSDGRFKRDLKKDVAGLDFIKQLNPVSYLLDKDAIDKFLGIPDSLRIERAASRKTPQRQVGFVAQEVEAIVKKSGFVFSGVETPQNENDPYAIRYSEFVIPLVKAVQELSAMVDSRQKEITKLKEAVRKYQQDNLANQKKSVYGALSQNDPNPFSSSTEIQMELPEVTRHASLIIYNLEGKQLKNIQVKERGATTIKISGSEFNPGMYLYALIADGKVVDTKRLILTK
jgi:hypothetical protein